MWKRLKHENIVPFIGITSTPFQLISKWMDGGHLREYIGKHPGVSRLGLVSISCFVFDSTFTFSPDI